MDGLAGGSHIASIPTAASSAHAATQAHAIMSAAHQHTFGKEATSPVVTAPVTRDLIAEWNAAIVKVEKWRSVEWIRGKIEA